MGYAAYDNNGQVDLVGSATAYWRFVEWASARGGELAVLAENGVSENLPQLITELKTSKADEPTAELMRVHFLELAEKAFEILIVSDS